MDPVRQNPIQRTVRSVHMCMCCTIAAHNIAQNRPDSFPSYPPDNRHCSNNDYLRQGGTKRGITVHNTTQKSQYPYFLATVVTMRRNAILLLTNRN